MNLILIVIAISLVLSKACDHVDNISSSEDRNEIKPYGVDSTKTRSLQDDSSLKCIYEVVPVNPKYNPTSTSTSSTSSGSNVGLEKKNPTNMTFPLKPLSHSLITFDFRHLNYDSFEPHKQWDIKFTLKTNDSREINLLPRFVSNTEFPKISAFMLLNYIEANLALHICVMNRNHLSYVKDFFNISSFETVYPQRQKGNDPQSQEMTQFFVLVYNDGEVDLPLNVPSISATTQNVDALLTKIDQDRTPVRHKLTEGKEKFQPNSKFWESSEFFVTNFLPYFSNCQGFDSFIPLVSLFEQHEKCILIPEAETEVVSLYDFGKEKPRADSCVDIEIKCVYDEVPTESPQISRWFEVKSGTSLFKLTRNPYTIGDIRSKADFSERELVDVSTSTYSVEGKIPKVVELDLKYYQTSKNTKKLVLAEVAFLNFVTIPDSSKNIEYTLRFNYQPMSHTQLIINFALSWEIYLIMYLAICLISFVIVLIIHFYHALFFREEYGRGFNKPKLNIFSYMRLTLSPVSGLFLSAIPILLLVILISLIMKGYLMGIQIYSVSKDCDYQQEDFSASNCVYGMFDRAYTRSKTLEIDLKSVRYGRIGLSFVICGLYMLFKGSALLIPKPSRKKKTENVDSPENFDGNIFETRQWKIYFLVFISFIIVLLDLNLIYFSYTDFFAKNLWLMMGVFKISFQFLEEILEIILGETLLVAPFSSNLGMMLNLVTYGASNFVEFLKSYLIGVAIMILERNYFNIAMDKIKKNLEIKIIEFTNFIKKIFSDEFADEWDDEETSKTHIPETLMTREDTKLEESFAEEMGDSDIVLTEEYEKSISESSDSAMATDEEQMIPDNQASSKAELNDSVEESDYFEFHLKKLSLHKEAQKTLENFRTLKMKKLNNLSDEYSREDYHNFIDCYLNIVNDTTTLFYFPITIGIIWIFYDETNMADNYNIKKEGFIYYFLFAIVLIPFQILIDGVFFTMIENYLKINFKFFLNKMNKKFDSRKKRWKNTSQNHDKNLDPEERSIDSSCFSSQLYFSNTIHLSGQVFLMLGLQTIISSFYNPFSDIFAFLICILWFTVCLIMEKLCLLMADIFGIWSLGPGQRFFGLFKIKKVFQVYPTKGNISTQIQKQKSDPEFNLITTTSIIDSKSETSNAKLIPSFSRAHVIKEKEERLKELSQDFSGDKFISEEFRRHFILTNRKWMKENLRLIFSPSTLRNKRNLILNSFSSIYLELNKQESNIIEIDEDEEDMVQLNTVPLQEFQDSKSNITPSTVFILKIWVERSRKLHLIRTHISGLLEEMTRPECEFCSVNFGLRAEIIDNLEDLYSKFMKISEFPENSFKQIIKWQTYFQKNASVRTICYYCSNHLLNHYSNYVTKKNSQMLSPTTVNSRPEIKSRTKTRILVSKKTQSFNSSIDQMAPNKYLLPEKNKILKSVLLHWLSMVRHSSKYNTRRQKNKVSFEEDILN